MFSRVHNTFKNLLEAGIKNSIQKYVWQKKPIEIFCPYRGDIEKEGKKKRQFITEHERKP